MRSRLRIEFYSLLLKVRPARLGAFLKRLFRVQRIAFAGRHEQKFWIDPASHFGLELMREGVYEPSMTNLIEKLLRPGDTFVDVGGNEGYFSVLASRLVQNGSVHCLEPQSRLRPVLEKNVALNGLRNVHVHSLAVSDKAVSEVLFLHPDTNTGASSLLESTPGAHTETVTTTTLAAFLEDNRVSRVRLMKIDCEGGEHGIVLGAERVFANQNIEFLALEYHPHIIGNEKCNSINRVLRRAGYQITKADGMWIYHLPGLEKELTAFRERFRVDWQENGVIEVFPLAG